MDYKLFTSQRNEVAALAQEKELQKEEFMWTKVNHPSLPKEAFVEKLTHIPTSSYFVFDNSKSGFSPTYFPSDDLPKEVAVGYLSNWPSVLVHLKKWLAIVKREHQPDLWEEPAGTKRLIVNDLDDLENSPFSHAELIRISTSIKELRAFLISHGTYTSQQLRVIDSRLTHLEESSNRLGRKDWMALLMGTLVNIGVGVALPPEVARQMIDSAAASFGWIVSNVLLIR